MSGTHTTTVPATAIDSTALPIARDIALGADERELICSEIWGGNKFVSTTIRLPGLVGTIYSKPCKGENGGDVHYLTACSAGSVARICLADVMGHGEDVAQMSNWLLATLRKHMNHKDPEQSFEELNQLAADQGVQYITTAICVSYQSVKGRLLYCLAGHHPALIHKAGTGKVEELKLDDTKRVHHVSDLPFGVEAESQYTLGEACVEPGDRLLLYSDGIIETPGANRDYYGLQRLTDLMTQNADLDHHALGEKILEDLAAFNPHNNLEHDDVTFMLLDATERPQGPMLYRMLKSRLRKMLVSTQDH